MHVITYIVNGDTLTLCDEHFAKEVALFAIDSDETVTEAAEEACCDNCEDYREVASCPADAATATGMYDHY